MIKPITEATRLFLKPIVHNDPFRDFLRIDAKPSKLRLSIFSKLLTTGSDGSKVTLEMSPQDSIFAHRFFNRFPYKRSILGRKEALSYEVGATDYSYEIISNLFPSPQNIIFATQDALVTWSKLAQHAAEGDNNALRTAEFKTNKVEPFYPLDVPDHVTLMPHQTVQCVNAVQSDYFSSLTGTGTGKTLVGIVTANTLANDIADPNTLRLYRVLVLCPKGVRFNWKDEFQQYCTHTHKCTVIRGKSASERHAEVVQGLMPSMMAMSEGNIEHIGVVVMGYESFVRTPQMHNIEWDLCILDEAHNIANTRTKRTKAILDINATRKLSLTATPIRNGTPLDLYPQFEYLHKGASGFTSEREFKFFFGKYIKTGTHMKLSGMENIPLLQERLARHAFIYSKEEALPDLPEKTHTSLECSLTDAQLEAYNSLLAFLQAKFACELTGEQTAMTVQNILTQMLRLAQITAGFYVTDTEFDSEGEVMSPSVINRFDPNPKLELLVSQVKEHLEENPHSKFQVWSWFVPSLKQISARFTLEGIPNVLYYGGTSDLARKEAEDDFNCDPEIKGFIGNPMAGGIGLNLLGYNYRDPKERHLPTNCDMVNYFSNGWSYVIREQSEGRPHRKGCRVPVQVYDYLVPGSIDEVIFQRLRLKKEISDMLQDLEGIFNEIMSLKPYTNGEN